MHADNLCTRNKYTPTARVRWECCYVASRWGGRKCGVLGRRKNLTQLEEGEFNIYLHKA